MAITGRSFAERVNRWQVLVHNLKESRAAGSDLDDELAAIGDLLAEARALQDRQAQLRSESQGITKRLGEIVGRGDRIRSRMGAVLQGKLGFTSEELIRYGFRPLRLPIRRRPRQAPPAGEQPPAGQQPPAGTVPAPAPGTAPAAAPAPSTTPAVTAPRS